jgi:hypothetical protein
MAKIELNFARDVTGVDNPNKGGYTVQIARNDGEPLSLEELHGLLLAMASDRPLQPDTSPRARRHDYSFVGREYVYELIQWSDEDVNLKAMKLGRWANSAWHLALLAMKPGQDPQVVSLDGKAGPARLVDAGYLQRHPTPGHYIVSPQYAGYKLGWRPTDSVIVFGVPFPVSMFQAPT